MAMILIVEDDAGAAQMIRDALTMGGFEVRHCFDGVYALEFLGLKPPEPPAQEMAGPDWMFKKGDWTTEPAQQGFPDVVVTDCMMPRLDGFSLATALANDERMKKLPVIVLTSKIKMEEPFLQLANVTGFLLKPVRPMELLAMVQKALPGAS